MNLPDAAVGSILAAVVTALISLLGLVISKENKVSEFRQAWIDSLRQEISNVISHNISIAAPSILGVVDARDRWKESKEDYVEINKSAMCIRLRLNPKEPTNQTILKCLADLEKATMAVPLDGKLLNTLMEELLESTQCVLKTEWTRVKDGERAFRTTRLLASIALGVSVLVLLFAVGKQFYPF